MMDRYAETVYLEEMPNMDVITKLVQKGQEEKRLRVRFKLESEQYDTLAAYFGMEDTSAIVLAKKALEEFISMI
jgi:hypothetical protein